MRVSPIPSPSTAPTRTSSGRRLVSASTIRSSRFSLALASPTSILPLFRRDKRVSRLVGRAVVLVALVLAGCAHRGGDSSALIVRPDVLPDETLGVDDVFDVR